MADTTTDISSSRGSGTRAGKGWKLPVKAAEAIPKGVLITIDANGFAKNGADTAATFFGGVSLEAVTGGAASGDNTIRAARSGIFAFAMTGGGAAGDLGQPVYIVDNQTVGLAGDTTNDVPCGTLIGWDVSNGKVASGVKCLIDISLT